MHPWRRRPPARPAGPPGMAQHRASRRPDARRDRMPPDRWRGSHRTRSRKGRRVETLKLDPPATQSPTLAVAGTGRMALSQRASGRRSRCRKVRKRSGPQKARGGEAGHPNGGSRFKRPGMAPGSGQSGETSPMHNDAVRAVCGAGGLFPGGGLLLGVEHRPNVGITPDVLAHALQRSGFIRQLGGIGLGIDFGL